MLKFIHSFAYLIAYLICSIASSLSHCSFASSFICLFQERLKFNTSFAIKNCLQRRPGLLRHFHHLRRSISDPSGIPGSAGLTAHRAVAWCSPCFGTVVGHPWEAFFLRAQESKGVEVLGYPTFSRHLELTTSCSCRSFQECASADPEQLNRQQPLPGCALRRPTQHLPARAKEAATYDRFEVRGTIDIYKLPGDEIPVAPG